MPASRRTFEAWQSGGRRCRLSVAWHEGAALALRQECAPGSFSSAQPSGVGRRERFGTWFEAVAVGRARAMRRNRGLQERDGPEGASEVSIGTR